MRGRLGSGVRRTGEDVRVEMTPMIDVVFLLLTFFVFSIVLMIRADVLDVQLPELASGQPAQRVTPITVAISETGQITVNREPVEAGSVLEQVRALREQFGDGPLFLAVDTRSEAGVMMGVMDAFYGAGLDFSLIGKRAADERVPGGSVNGDPQQDG